jgi:hypothetical protein
MILTGCGTAAAWGMNGVCTAYIAAQATSLAVLVAHAKHHYRSTFTFRSLLPTLQDVRDIVGRTAGALTQMTFPRSPCAAVAPARQGAAGELPVPAGGNPG